MKSFSLSAISALLAASALAHPVSLVPRQGQMSDIDITILQFALTLEHLENEFYKQAFRTFTLDHFKQAGFDESFFLNLQFIAADEAAHVQVLHTAISGAGAQPVAPCHYNFPITDVHSFVTLSAILESVGTSAYLGAAPFVTSKDILGVAGSILVTEALHTSLQRSSIGGIGAPDPFGTPLNANAVFTLAAQFITACPPENAPLPFMAFPGLKVDAQACFNEQHLLQQPAVPPSAAHQMPPSGMTTSHPAPPAAPAMPPAMPAHEAGVPAPPVAEAPPAMATPVMTPVIVTEIIGAVITPGVEAAPAEAMATPAPAMLKRSSHLSCPAPGAGTSISLTPDFAASSHDFSSATQVFVTFISGLNVVSVAVEVQKDAVVVVIVPPGVQGQVFILITMSDLSGGKVADGDVVFGPAIMEVSPVAPVLSL